MALNRAGIMANVLFLVMGNGRKNAHIVKMTDATDLPVCLKKNADKHKTMQGLAAWGHSSKGRFYGLKMTMTRDLAGHLLGLRLSSANANSRDISIQSIGISMASSSQMRAMCQRSLKKIWISTANAGSCSPRRQ